jgi:hypothetical protein
MCSSPAYPASAPLGGSTTGDRFPAFGSVASRTEDVTDFSSKGLLPQLIDVLHALTEGQDLLSRKVREARLEHYRHTDPVVEGSVQTEPSNPLAPPTVVGTGPDGSIGSRRELPPDNMEIGGGPASVNDFGNGPWPEPGIGASAVPVSSTIPETSSLSNPPTTMVTFEDAPADVPNETSVQTDWPAAPPSETTTASLNRDYNFFDELDARLADLQNPTDGSGD